MSFRDTQNPGIGGLDEITDAEALFLQNLAGLPLVQGDVLYHNGTSLTRLAAGTNGHFLKTQGAGANPAWAAATASITGTDTHVTFFDGANNPAGDAGFTYNKTTDTATLAGNLKCEDLEIEDSDASHYLTITTISNLTAGRTLTLVPGDASRTLTVSGDATISQDYSTTGNPQFATIEIGHASDTTLARVAAGRLSVEAVAVTRSSSGSSTDNTLARFDLTTGDLIQTTGIVVDDSNNISGVGTLGVGAITSSGTFALGANSITMTGSLAATGARATKGWFTDVESTNIPTVGGTALLTSLTAPQFTTIELGHATDTTLSRASAGRLAVEGVNVVTTSSTDTLTNKTLTSPTLTTPSAFTTGGTITLAENTSIALDPAGSADGKYTGITITGTAGATLAFGDLVYLSSTDSRWELADADAATTADRFLGMCVLAAAADGDPTTLLLLGQIRADAKFPALTIGSAVYVGETAGAIQVAIPTGADNVIRRVGYALTADEIYFNPSMDSQTTVA